MATMPRPTPWIWITWLTGLLSGDKSCTWAAWFRAHHKYDKRPDHDAERLTLWKAEHAARVRERAAALFAQGYEVFVEDQNQFRLRGRAATVSGKPDLIAVGPDSARIEDVKTGLRRESDVWQMVMYLLFAPSLLDSLRDYEGEIVGALVYSDGMREVRLGADREQYQALVVQQIRAAAGSVEPARVPSWGECRFCDVAECPDRIVSRPHRD